LDGGGEAEVALGWSREPRATVGWSGGGVVGFVAPAGEGARLVASPPLAGLAQLAPPDPNDLPNNHLAYAGQWFFFAATALAVYWLALRRRRQERA
jgi:surfeit locus 1 family protein